MLPLYELSQESWRAHGWSYQDAIEYSLPPINLVTLIFPFFFRAPDGGQWSLWQIWECVLYVGVVPLMLAVVAALAVRRWAVTFFTVAAVVSAWWRSAATRRSACTSGCGDSRHEPPARAGPLHADHGLCAGDAGRVRGRLAGGGSARPDDGAGDGVVSLLVSRWPCWGCSASWSASGDLAGLDPGRPAVGDAGAGRDVSGAGAGPAPDARCRSTVLGPRELAEPRESEDGAAAGAARGSRCCCWPGANCHAGALWQGAGPVVAVDLGDVCQRLSPAGRRLVPGRSGQAGRCWSSRPMAGASSRGPKSRRRSRMSCCRTASRSVWLQPVAARTASLVRPSVQTVDNVLLDLWSVRWIVETSRRSRCPRIGW